jgi:hypothetical protein
MSEAEIISSEEWIPPNVEQVKENILLELDSIEGPSYVLLDHS